MGRTPDAYDGPRIDESIIWDERTSDPAEEQQTQFVQGKGLLTLFRGVARPVGETQEAIWQTEVDDVFVDTPPGSPTTGHRVIVGDSPTGAFVGHAGEIAEWDGSAWWFTEPKQGTVTMVKAVGINTPFVQSAMSTPWVWDKLNPGGFFGANLETAEDLTLSSTTSSSWQTKLTLTTTSLPFGTYFMIASAVMSCSLSSTQIGARFTFDGSEVGEMTIKPNVADGDVPFSPFNIEEDISGVHTVLVQYRKAGGGGNALIRGVKIALWRLS